MYTFSNGRLKVANKQYSSCKSDYEITLGNDADIRGCPEDTSIDTVKINFTGFDSLEHIEKETTVDVIGIVKQAGARPLSKCLCFYWGLTKGVR